MRIKNARDQHLGNIYLLENDWTSCKYGRRRFCIGSWIANIRKIESSHMKQKHKMRLITPDTSLSNPDPPCDLLTPPSIIMACLDN